MTLQVYTARITYRGPDRLDVTRKSAGPDGIHFAPSWGILRPMIDLRRHDDIGHARAWPKYVEAYTAEMRQSYQRNRATWEVLLARTEVTLICYCVDPAHCHRTVLAGILGKLGAEVNGERPEPRDAKLREAIDGMDDRQLDLLAAGLESELAMRRGKLP